MTATSQERSQKFSPLLGVLKQVQWLLENNHPQQIIIASMSVEEFKKQKLPAHCKVQQRKLKGPRVPSDSVHRNTSTMTWPNDGLTENNYPAWHIVVRGQADIRIMDYAIRCHPGDIVFTPANVPKIDGTRPHYEEITPDAFCDILVVRPSIGGLNIHVCRSVGDRHYKSTEGEGALVKHALAASLSQGLAAELQSFGSDESTFRLFLAMLLFMQHKIEQGECLAIWEFPTIPLIASQRDPITQALEYMKNHYYSPLTIDKMARWIGVSRTVFVRQFRQQTGTTFRSHLIKLRLHAAEKHLTHSNSSIERISVSVGLTSNQLRNLFQQHHNCTPAEFRQQQRKVRN